MLSQVRKALVAAGASPRLDDLFSRSAKIFTDQVDEATIDSVAQLLFSPRHFGEVPTQIHPHVADAILIATQNDADAGARMLEAASAAASDHRTAWEAIAAEGLLGGDNGARQEAVDLLQDLAMRERIPEAAAYLCTGQATFSVDAPERERWRALAHELWPAMNYRATVSFAGHYLLHVLAAAEDGR